MTVDPQEYHALQVLANAVRDRFINVSQWVDYPESILPNEFKALLALDAL